jgi:hypothetical protein
MTLSGSGLQDSGIDRALRNALDNGLDKELASGEIWTGERTAFPDPVPAVPLINRPWQRPIFEQRTTPAVRSSATEPPPPPPIASPPGTPGAAAAQAAPGEPVEFGDSDKRYRYILERKRVSNEEYTKARTAAVADKPEKKRDFAWRPDLTGIIVVHGIGPQLAGQTLLDWTKPIIQLLSDAARGDDGLKVPLAGEEPIKDPVVKSNIDFSGETFPVVQIGVPARTDVPADDPRAQQKTWVFTETWWASQVRAPTLATMISWLGEQGGVGRIVQGIQENKFGGPGAFFARLSLQPIVSVLTSFVLLLFVLLLALSKLIPFGPLRDAVVLRLAASFLTDWFGGARTLLLDPAQSANVRYRLLTTVKALRAYGCRDVIIIAHSGGTMVSMTTLTDPAFKGLRVQKLITIGEALNLGWRLNDANPDDPPPSPPIGDRMAADIGTLQPDLQWRDFWGTDDPAPSGPPRFPHNFDRDTFPRFTAERVYNRMSILEDHGGYWDNDEHFVIPLIRELDVPTNDRGASRFFSDDVESHVRSRRKERVGLLALWRRALLSLPVIAIAAAATVSIPGIVAIVGTYVLQLFGLIPGNEIVGQAAASFVSWIASISTENVPLIPAFLRFPSLLTPLYSLGTSALEAILLMLLLFGLLPGQIDRLWANPERGPLPRFVLLVLDYAVGIGAFAMVVAAFFLLLSPDDRTRILAGISWGPFVLLAGAALFAIASSDIGRRLRKQLREKVPDRDAAQRAFRSLGIAVSSIALGTVLIGTLLIFLSIVLVIINSGNGKPNSVYLDNHQFVIGAIAIIVIFNLLSRLGIWRYDIWDARERRGLRRAPLEPLELPVRTWPYILGFILTLVAFAATSIVALGADGAVWLGVGRDTWLVAVVVAIVAIVLFSLAKDIVDNDIDTGAGAAGSAPGITGGAPTTMTTSEPPKPAGSS